MFILLLLLLQIAPDPSSQARIVLFAPQMISHVLEQAALGEELMIAGHQVHIVLESTFPPHLVKSFLGKGFQLLTFKVPAGLERHSSKETELRIAKSITHGNSSFIHNIAWLINLQETDCGLVMEDEQFLRQVRDQKFDLAIIEPFLLSPCHLILPHHLRIPYVTLTNQYSPWSIRSPALPSFYPRYFLPFDDTRDIRFVTRVAHLVFLSMTAVELPWRFFADDSLLRKYAPECSSYDDLLRKSLLFFYEIDEHLSAPLPALPNHISVAGMTCKAAEPLPETFELIMNRSSTVVLLSFGSMGSLIDLAYISKFFEAFGRLEETVIVRMKLPKELRVPSNVHVFDWIPQNDILGHEKTKLFITHCGNNGQHEALYHGVPMISFPLFGEQKQNAHRAQIKGFAVTMDIRDFTADALHSNIRELLDDSKYANAVQAASRIFRDQPQTPQERAVFWINHVIKYGGDHLRSTAMDLPLYQFLMLDVFAVLAIVVFSILFVCARLFKCCFRFVFKTGVDKKYKKL